MNNNRLLLRFGAAAFATLLALSATGCSNPVTDLVDQVKAEIPQDITEEDRAEEEDQSSEEDPDSGSDNDAGPKVDVQFKGIPENFPDEVPLVSTDVVSSVEISGEDGEGIALTVLDSRAAADLTPVVREEFADWEEIAWTEMGELVSGQFSKGDVYVIVGIVPEDEGSLVQYMAYSD